MSRRCGNSSDVGYFLKSSSVAVNLWRVIQEASRLLCSVWCDLPTIIREAGLVACRVGDICHASEHRQNACWKQSWQTRRTPSYETGRNQLRTQASDAFCWSVGSNLWKRHRMLRRTRREGQYSLLLGSRSISESMQLLANVRIHLLDFTYAEFVVQEIGRRKHHAHRPSGQFGWWVCMWILLTCFFVRVMSFWNEDGICTNESLQT